MPTNLSTTWFFIAPLINPWDNTVSANLFAWATPVLKIKSYNCLSKSSLLFWFAFSFSFSKALISDKPTFSICILFSSFSQLSSSLIEVFLVSSSIVPSSNLALISAIF
jgi:hypothetical protein